MTLHAEGLDYQFLVSLAQRDWRPGLPISGIPSPAEQSTQIRAEGLDYQFLVSLAQRAEGLDYQFLVSLAQLSNHQLYLGP